MKITVEDVAFQKVTVEHLPPDKKLAVSLEGAKLSLCLLGAGPPCPDGGGPDSLLTDLEAYYRLDSSLADSSGNGRDLDASGAEAYSTGGGVLGDALTAGPASVTGLSVAFTDLSTSFWVKFTATALSEGVHALTEAGGDTLAIVCDRVTRVVTVTPLGQSSVASAALDTLVWHHVAVVCSGGVLTLYVNGVSVGTGTAPAASTLTGWSSNPTTRAQHDEWAIASRAWTEAEVLRLYNGGAGFDPTA